MRCVCLTQVSTLLLTLVTLGETWVTLIVGAKDGIDDW